MHAELQPYYYGAACSHESVELQLSWLASTSGRSWSGTAVQLGGYRRGLTPCALPRRRRSFTSAPCMATLWSWWRRVLSRCALSVQTSALDLCGSVDLFRRETCRSSRSLVRTKLSCNFWRRMRLAPLGLRGPGARARAHHVGLGWSLPSADFKVSPHTSPNAMSRADVTEVEFFEARHW